MPEHEELREDIPAWAVSGLSGEALDRLERHLRECGACARMAATARRVVEAVREGGEAILSGHPSPEEIARLARMEPGEGPLAPHVLHCERCGLEVSSLRRRLATKRAAHRRRITRWALTAAAAAAGLVVGILLGPSPPPGGAPPSVWLALVRGGETGPVLEIGPEDGEVLLMAAVDLSVEDLPSRGVLAEVLGPGGSSVWSVRVPRTRVAQSLERTETLVLAVPAASLEEGRHELRLRFLSGSPTEESVNLRFEVARRP